MNELEAVQVEEFSERTNAKVKAFVTDLNNFAKTSRHYESIMKHFAEITDCLGGLFKFYQENHKRAPKFNEIYCNN